MQHFLTGVIRRQRHTHLAQRPITPNQSLHRKGIQQFVSHDDPANWISSQLVQGGPADLARCRCGQPFSLPALHPRIAFHQHQFELANPSGIELMEFGPNISGQVTFTRPNLHQAQGTRRRFGMNLVKPLRQLRGKKGGEIRSH